MAGRGSVSTSDLALACRLGRRLEGETVIDIHGHIGPYFNFHIPRSGTEGMLAAMDAVGVQRIAVSGNAGMGPGTALGNEAVRDAVERYPDRFLGYLFVSPHYPEETVRQLAAAEDEGWHMVKIHPASHQYPASGDAYRPVWEYANGRGLILLAHTWHGTSSCAPSLLCELADQYPDVDVILGHSGGVVAGFGEAIDAAKRRPNVYLDLTGSAHLHFAAVEQFARQADTDRVLFGSDLPFISLPPQIGKVLLADIDDNVKRKFLGLNAQRLLEKHGLV